MSRDDPVERSSPLRARTVVHIALLLAAAVALALLVLRDGGSEGFRVEARDPLPGIDEIRVNVAGAVHNPAIVVAHPGERVGDVIARAGGLTAAADTATLNLARRVVDQDHIYVPLRGEGTALLDLNEATLEELETLPGIGPVRGERILDARRQSPFTSSDELIERELIPASVYEQIRDLVATPR